jgi:hypothetical protein
VDLTASAYLFYDGPAPNANTYQLYGNVGTDEPVWVVYDNGGASRFNNPNVFNWAADTDYTLRVRTGGNNDLGLYWNAAWQLVMGGAGTGVRSAAQTTTYIGSSSTVPANVWTKELYIYPRTRF